MNLSRMMIDRMLIEWQDGSRHGPFKTRFGSETLLVFQDELKIAEGDRVIQTLSDGSELAHLVEGFSFNPARGKVPAHFSIRIVRASEPTTREAPAAAATTQRTDADIDAQGILTALRSLEHAIERAPFSAGQKEEAARTLRTLLDNEIVASLLKRQV